MVRYNRERGDDDKPKFIEKVVSPSDEACGIETGLVRGTVGELEKQKWREQFIETCYLIEEELRFTLKKIIPKPLIGLSEQVSRTGDVNYPIVKILGENLTRGDVNKILEEEEKKYEEFKKRERELRNQFNDNPSDRDNLDIKPRPEGWEPTLLGELMKEEEFPSPEAYQEFLVYKEKVKEEYRKEKK
ncbi:hypothetical protein CSA08_02115 [Candidatus Gracilibacteria bacterium]|nr:MAG: hypothetical protein CSA08_02115 [Candidatus Gracilibacteria bacterium]